MAITRRTVLGGGVALAGAAAAGPVRLPKKIRLALDGLEGHAGEILDPLPQLPDVELVGICDRDPKAIARAAKNQRVAAAKKYSRLEEMLEQERPDVVAVCNENGERAGAIIECARRKIHVIAEKPLAITSEDFARVREIVDRQGVQLGMLLPMRVDPPFAALRKIVQDGLIGDVIQVSAQKSYKAGSEEWRHRRQSYGSTILWIGIHMIDLMRWTSGREFVNATAWQARIGFPELGDQENVSASVFELDNRGLAILRMDYLRPQTAPTHGDDRLRLAGSKGVAEYTEATGVTLLTADGKPRVISDLPPQGSVFIDFLQATFNGAKPQISLSDIWQVNEITLAAHESASKEAKKIRIHGPVSTA
jgi:predicted dehydrogenase